jgi:hypothetical protein
VGADEDKDESDDAGGKGCDPVPKRNVMICATPGTPMSKAAIQIIVSLGAAGGVKMMPACLNISATPIRYEPISRA